MTKDVLFIGDTTRFYIVRQCNVKFFFVGIFMIKSIKWALNQQEFVFFCEI